MSNDNTKVFDNVTLEIFVCVKKKGANHSPPAVYDPVEGNKGTVTIKPWVGTIKLDFDFDPSAKTLTYTLVEKPGIVPISRLWGGFEDTVNECKSYFAS